MTDPGLPSLLLRVGGIAACLAAATVALPAQNEGSTGQQPQRPQDPPGQLGQTQGSVGRDGMWYAPSEADWKKPMQIEFQRTWEDAVAISQRSGKPILICVNMDGEPASEHYAGVRYRQPEIGGLYKDYVCVIASVYRHTPRDYDENGERVLCPRFGSVTCGEHIHIEPFLYEKFLDGKRIAPRHIMVELDGSEVYDIYYAFDTASVFGAIKNGIQERSIQAQPDLRGDRSIFERVASPDLGDRRAVEAAYREGDRETRRKLLEAAAQNVGTGQSDLLRLAIAGLDTELAAQARAALARSDSQKAVELINEALRAPMDAGEREQLVAALERLAANSPKARMYASVQRGLVAKSRDVDVGGWSAALQGQEYPAPPSQADLEAQLDAAGQAEESAEQPGKLARAALASLQLALDPEYRNNLLSDPRSGRRYLTLMFEDAQRTARRAQELVPADAEWRVGAAVALTDYYLGDRRGAYEVVERVAGRVEAGDTSWEAMATLALFAEARQRAIWRQLRQGQNWPREWLTDVNSAYAVVAQHPAGTADHAVVHYDFLKSLGGVAAAWRVLNGGLERFPTSARLHDRLRAHVLEDRGAEALDAVYEALLKRSEGQPAAADIEWFAGYAAMVVAEFHRKNNAQGLAREAYDRALAHFDAATSMKPDVKASADHFAAMSLGGKARAALDSGDLDIAVGEVLAAFERYQPAANALDGLTLSSVDTAKTLVATLRENGREELAGRVDAALQALPPELLKPPVYETGGGPSPDAQRAMERARGEQGDGGQQPPAGGQPRRRRGR